MSRFVTFINDWMLPIAIATGAAVCLILHFVPALSVSAEPAFTFFAKSAQPFLVALMLFLQFNKVSPHDLKLRRWHLILLVFQCIMFVSLALIATAVPKGEARILIECAMLCLICPTAAAAGVITDRLGGSLSDTVTYVVMINVAAAIIIPVIIPIVHPSSEMTFLSSFISICVRVFPLLVLPLLIAWLIRYTMKKLHHFLLRYVGWAFQIWGVTLCLSIYLATRALLNSGISLWGVVLICLVSLACTILQFLVGRRAGGASRSDSITAGQALGQKNSGFLVWLGYTYMTPVTSVAAGLYSVWQNIVNSWELYEKRHHESESL